MCKTRVCEEPIRTHYLNSFSCKHFKKFIRQTEKYKPTLKSFFLTLEEKIDLKV
jgi:hypothetical protein